VIAGKFNRGDESAFASPPSQVFHPTWICGLNRCSASLPKPQAEIQHHAFPKPRGKTASPNGSHPRATLVVCTFISVQAATSAVGIQPKMLGLHGGVTIAQAVACF